MKRASPRSALAVVAWLALASCGHHEQGPTGPGACAGVVQVDGALTGSLTALPGTVLHLAVTPPRGASGTPTWSSTGGTLGTPMDSGDGSSMVDLTLPMAEGNLAVRADWAGGCTSALAVTVSTDVGTDAGDEGDAGEAGDANDDAGDDAGDANGDAGVDVPSATDVPVDVPVAMDVGVDVPTARDVAVDVPFAVDTADGGGAEMDAGTDAGLDAAD